MPPAGRILPNIPALKHFFFNPQIPGIKEAGWNADVRSQEEPGNPMTQPDLEAARAPLASLSTKIIVFVFLSTLATALLVSWISIQSTYDHLSQALDVEYPAALRRAGADVED